MQEALEPYMMMMSEGNGSRGDVVLNINGREMAKAVFNDFQYESNRLGVGTPTNVRRVG
jgi:hypothetical protein